LRVGLVVEATLGQRHDVIANGGDREGTADTERLRAQQREPSPLSLASLDAGDGVGVVPRAGASVDRAVQPATRGTGTGRGQRHQGRPSFPSTWTWPIRSSTTTIDR
jgi:hypothetical protein